MKSAGNKLSEVRANKIEMLLNMTVFARLLISKSYVKIFRTQFNKLYQNPWPQ